MKMHAIVITDRTQLDRLAQQMELVASEIRRGYLSAVSVAVDEIDQAAKFKVEDHGWGPPCTGELR